MYAYLEPVSKHGRGHDGFEPAAIGAPGADRPGLFGSMAFQQFAGSAAACLTLWDTEASAAAFRAERAELAALPADVYEITDTGEGPAAAQAPAYARLMYFDGPRTPEQAAAEDLAGRQRIWPVIRGLTGLVALYVLRRRDLGSVVITLATSVETLDASARAVMSTELTPGEDPALLPGPDRIEIHHVTGYHLSTTAAAATMKGH